jgi:hypothetical protein
MRKLVFSLVVVFILILPLVGAALAAVTVILTGAAWMGWNSPSRRPYWSLGGRMHYTLVALAGVAFVWWLSYWNLLGFRQCSSTQSSRWPMVRSVSSCPMG